MKGKRKVVECGVDLGTEWTKGLMSERESREPLAAIPIQPTVVFSAAKRPSRLSHFGLRSSKSGGAVGWRALEDKWIGRREQNLVLSAEC